MLVLPARQLLSAGSFRVAPVWEWPIWQHDGAIGRQPVRAFSAWSIQRDRIVPSDDLRLGDVSEAERSEYLRTL